MYEEFFVFIYIGLLGTMFLIGLRIFYTWKLANFKARATIQKKKDQDLPDDELEAYIRNPEETLKTLMAQRQVFEKEHDAGKLGAIDAQIKGLELICKIPAPIRPAAFRVIKKGLKQVEGMVEGI